MWGIILKKNNFYSLIIKRNNLTKTGTDIKLFYKFFNLPKINNILIFIEISRFLFTYNKIVYKGQKNIYFSFINNLLINKIYFSDNNKLSWVAELILHFGANNIYFLVRSPLIVDAIPYFYFQYHVLAQKAYSQEERIREILFSISVGRCGFKKSEKRTSLAFNVIMRAVLWICKRFYQALTTVKLNFVRPGVDVIRHIQHFRYLFVGRKQLIIHRINDISPLPYNGVRKRRVGRSRFRYHQYTYKRFGTIIKISYR